MSETLTRQAILDHGPLPASLLPSKVQPTPDPGTAAINVQSVLADQGRMGFSQPRPILPLAPTSTYHSPQNGGTQRAALAEIAGYFFRR